MPIFFGSLIAWLAVGLGRDAKKLAFRLGSWAVYIIAAGVSVGLLIAGTIAILNGINTAVPAQVNQVWGWVMPSNAGEIILAIVSARFIRAIHDFRMKILAMKFQATSI